MRRILAIALAVGIGGLPNVSTAQAQQGVAMPPAEYKDPGTATIIGVLVTGGGQMYAGETSKGLKLLAIGAGSMIAGEVLTISSCSSLNTTCSAGPIAVGALVYLGTWAYGLMDAGDAARRHNSAVGFKTARVVPVIQTIPTRAGETLDVGLTLRF